jgi:SAM-dependent methyltransferase
LERTRHLNNWGHDILLPDTILEDSYLATILRQKLIELGKCLGWSPLNVEALFSRLLEAHRFRSMLEFEHYLGGYVRSSLSLGRLRKALDERASRILKEISGSITGDSILDIGCGDGMVPHLIDSKAYKIQLMDVVKYVDERVCLPFSFEIEDSWSFDTTLLLTVLHHTDDPLALLRSAINVTRKRLIILERVVGMSASDSSEWTNSPLYGLCFDDQIRYAVFVDWFYNRVLHSDVPVPYNFTSPSSWRRIFRDLGLRVSVEFDLGVDQPLVPEHHYLFVLDKG